MINQVSGAAGRAYQPETRQKSAAKDEAKTDSGYDSAYSVEISVGGKKGDKALSSEAIEGIRNQADTAASALKDIVEKLLVQQQGGDTAFSITVKILGASNGTGDAAGNSQDNADWGADAVSDKIVNFAKSLSGGDPSKIEMLRDAIDKGFASAKKTLGGKLPDISMQTYDAVMSKLDDWAGENKTEEAVAAG